MTKGHLVNDIDLLDEGYGWTAKRISAVRAGDLAVPTPCTDWDLGQLLNHLLGALGLHLDALGGEDVHPGQYDPDTDRTGDDPASAFDAVATRAAKVWRTSGVFDRVCTVPFGSTTGRVVATLHLTEVVVHGWDISKATGEHAAIPDQLAETILERSRPLVTEAHRGSVFAHELSYGGHPAARLVAFLGRTP